MNTLQSIWNGLDWSYLLSIALSWSFRRCCASRFTQVSHGWVAYRLGDPTAKDAGRLTLNPLKHIDMMGLLMMVVFKFGWAKPVPVNMMRFRNPKRGMALTALAGPASNCAARAACLCFCAACGTGCCHSVRSVLDFIFDLLLTTAYHQSSALGHFQHHSRSRRSTARRCSLRCLPDSGRMQKLMRYERYGMILLLVLVATGVLGKPLTTVTEAVFDKLFVFAEWGYELIVIFG